MIYSLKGIVTQIGANVVVIECNDIGYKCNVSNNTIYNLKINEKCYLYTYMNIKDDSISLFAFSTTEELECFKILIGISGVGPKAAISILSQFTPNSLSVAISTDDYKSITMCPGIGTKIAQRIVLELKGKLVTIDTNSTHCNYNNNLNNNNFKEAYEALISLGYNESDILKILKKYNQDLKVEEIIKMALKEL